MFSVKLVLALVLSVDADTYMHIPRGSNNRLNGQNRERRNANRLFDSQNNARGGYNVGRDTARTIDKNGRERRVPVGEMKYYAGSQLSIEWTNQHECGGEKAQCDIIIQYMCDIALRDGTTTGQIPDRHSKCPARNCNSRNRRTRRFGQQEQVMDYQLCRFTERNKGLFTADQNLKGSAAIFTRQNAGGARRGLECPEERDYYPHWRPSPWKDIAILTSHPERCAAMQAESANVKGKSICVPQDPVLYFSKLNQIISRRGRRRKEPSSRFLIPNNKEACESRTIFNMGFRWLTYASNNLTKPDCLPSLKSRDNQLGNGGVRPYAHVYNWTVPNINADACALRIRYNISTGDFPPFSTDAKNNNRKGNTGAPKLDIGSEYGLNDPSEAKQRGYFLKNNPVIKPLKTADGTVINKLNLQLAINTAQIGRTFQDRSHAFKIKPRPTTIPDDAKIYNLNVRGKRGNIVQVFPATEYDFAPNSLHVKQGDYVHPQWTGSNRNPRNNDGEGRRGTDRSNIVVLKPKNYPEGTGANMLQPNDRAGHLGNSYPENINKKSFLGLSKNEALRTAVLVPELLGLIKEEKTASNGATGNLFSFGFNDVGETDANDVEDEEAVDIEKKANPEKITEENSDFDQTDNADTDDEEDTENMEEKVNAKKTINVSSVQYDSIERTRRNIARRLRLATLDDAPAYFDLGPQKANVCGTNNYMCTRNNNFSNRSQKAKVEVECKK